MLVLKFHVITRAALWHKNYWPPARPHQLADKCRAIASIFLLPSIDFIGARLTRGYRIYLPAALDLKEAGKRLRIYARCMCMKVLARL
jgi:hypothetical protein